MYIGNELGDCQRSQTHNKAAENFQALTFHQVVFSLHVIAQLEMNQQKLWATHPFDEIMAQSLFALATNLEEESKTVNKIRHSFLLAQR